MIAEQTPATAHAGQRGWYICGYGDDGEEPAARTEPGGVYGSRAAAIRAARSLARRLTREHPSLMWQIAIDPGEWESLEGIVLDFSTDDSRRGYSSEHGGCWLVRTATGWSVDGA